MHAKQRTDFTPQSKQRFVNKSMHTALFSFFGVLLRVCGLLRGFVFWVAQAFGPKFVREAVRMGPVQRPNIGLSRLNWKSSRPSPHM